MEETDYAVKTKLSIITKMQMTDKFLIIWELDNIRILVYLFMVASPQISHRFGHVIYVKQKVLTFNEAKKEHAKLLG